MVQSTKNEVIRDERRLEIQKLEHCPFVFDFDMWIDWSEILKAVLMGENSKWKAILMKVDWIEVAIEDGYDLNRMVEDKMRMNGDDELWE